MERLARQPVPYRWCDLEFVRVHGFFRPSAPDAVVAIRVTDATGAVFRPRIPSREHPDAGMAPYVDFALTPERMDLRTAMAAVWVGDEEVWRGPLEAIADAESPAFRAEALVEVHRLDRPPILPGAERSVRWANRILRVARVLSLLIPPVVLLHLLTGAAFLLRRAFRRPDSVLWLFTTGLLLAVSAVLFLVSANFFELPGAYPHRYAMAAYPILDLFAVVVVLHALSLRDPAGNGATDA